MFKKADLSDLAAIVEFSQELRAQNAKMSFTEFDNKAFVEEQLNNHLISLYIAYDDKKVIAMFRGIRGENLKKHSVYVACAVRSSHRKQSLATKITEFALEDYKKDGILIARTKIYSWNKASIATILKCGFEQSGSVVMHEYLPEIDDYIDDLIFHKKI